MEATHACIEKETLTDGSLVYNVRLANEESLNVLIIRCYNKKAAEDLLKSLDSNAQIETN